MNNQSPTCRKTTRYRAETFDCMQYLFSAYNDHQIRAVLRFGDLLDASLLRQAVLRTAGHYPILACRFIPGPLRPHWKLAAPPAENLLAQALFSCSEQSGTDAEAEIGRFIAGRTDEKRGPQLAVRLVRADGKDTLCVVVNHMVCDGEGFKEYLYRLCETYAALNAGKTPPAGCAGGDRSKRQIFRRLTPAERRLLFQTPHGMTGPREEARFPFDAERTGAQPLVLRQTLSPARFSAVRAYGKARGFTVNDLVLAAYARALDRLPVEPAGTPLLLPCMVNLRRYLPEKKAENLCNLSSMVLCRAEVRQGEDFEATAARIHSEMSRLKNGSPGLGGLFLLHTLERLPFALFAALFTRHYNNPLLGITNIGILDESRLTFGAHAPFDAYIAASIKHPPYFQLAFTTYRNTLSLTVNQICTETDRETVRRFFALLDEELTL